MRVGSGDTSGVYSAGVLGPASLDRPTQVGRDEIVPFRTVHGGASSGLVGTSISPASECDCWVVDLISLGSRSSRLTDNQVRPSGRKGLLAADAVAWRLGSPGTLSDCTRGAAAATGPRVQSRPGTAA